LVVGAPLWFPPSWILVGVWNQVTLFISRWARECGSDRRTTPEGRGKGVGVVGAERFLADGNRHPPNPRPRRSAFLAQYINSKSTDLGGPSHKVFHIRRDGTPSPRFENKRHVFPLPNILTELQRRSSTMRDRVTSTISEVQFFFQECLWSARCWSMMLYVGAMLGPNCLAKPRALGIEFNARKSPHKKFGAMMC
jgi:hypothetical protein